MIKVELSGGGLYIAQEASEIVMQLKLEDWTHYSSVTDYQKNIQRRVEIFNGAQISYSNDLEFLNELQRIGFIKNIEQL